jgi:hypothetical protein
VTPEFLIKRILKAADAWSLEKYEEALKTSGTQLYYRNKRAAQLELLNYIKQQFIEGKE